MRDLCFFCRKRVTCKHRKSLQGIPDLFIAECNGKRIETQDERKARKEREIAKRYYDRQREF